MFIYVGVRVGEKRFCDKPRNGILIYNQISVKIYSKPTVINILMDYDICVESLKFIEQRFE